MTGSHLAAAAARNRLTIALLGLLPLLLASALARSSPVLSVPDTPSASSPASELPLSFAPNRGQADRRVLYQAQTGGFGVHLARDRVALSFDQGEREGYALHLRFAGANPDPRVVAGERLRGELNYIGERSSKTHIPTFGEVRYRELWPGIDMALRGASGKLKYEFRLAPGADPSKIQLAYAGASSLSVAGSGALMVHTPRGTLRDAAPRTYQRIDGRNVPVESRYSPTGGTGYGFALGSYDRSRPLVIDPGLAYSTFLGGSSSDTTRGLAVHADGSAYVAGHTESTNFPTTPGAYRTTPSGFFVTKLNQQGTALDYSTYLEGGGFFSIINAIAVDSQGSAYITGESADGRPFSTPGVFAPVCGGDPENCFDPRHPDGFVTKFSADGAAVVYSTFLGATDRFPKDIAVDDQGNAYVGGHLVASIQNFDGFVTKINPDATAAVYTKFVGGTDWDFGSGLAVDSTGHAYLAGRTQSTDFPVTPGAPDSVGAGDGFVSKLSADGSSFDYSTYLGGFPGVDEAHSIAVDGDDNAYVSGLTRSTGFPTTPGAYDPTLGGAQDAFITKINPAGTAFLYSTYLGGSNGEPTGGAADPITVDSQGRAWVTGLTSSSDFPVTPGAYDTSFDSTPSSYVTQLNAAGSALGYSTFLEGGATRDIGVDGRDSPYVAGDAGFSFPTTAGAFDPTFNGGSGPHGDAFVTKFSIPGKIVVVKDSEPNDPQNFSFTAGGGLMPTSFQLDDDSDGSIPNTQTFNDVEPGAGYSIAETAAAGWYLGVATCDDGSPVANIDVSAGETVTCTFTNARVYPRPGGATPLRVPLVPAFRVCNPGMANSQHVGPLAEPSCEPPVQASTLLTTSTTGRGSGVARFDVLAGNPATSVDEADVKVFTSASDVRSVSGPMDYTGNLILTTTVYRLTDRANGPSGTASGTASDLELAFPLGCSATPDPNVGSTCSLSSTYDSLLPGLAPEGKRSVARLTAAKLKDAGADGDVGAPAVCPPQCGTGDERTYLEQGVFLP